MVVVDVVVAADFMLDFMVAPSDVAAAEAAVAEAAVAAVAAAFLSAAVVAVVSEAAAYRGASAVFADPRRALLGIDKRDEDCLQGVRRSRRIDELRISDAFHLVGIYVGRIPKL